jgi:hypothetical protein
MEVNMQKKMMKRTLALIMVAMMVMVSMPVSYASIVEALGGSVAVNAQSNFSQVVMAENDPLEPAANVNSINVFTHGAEVFIYVNGSLYLNGTKNHVIKQQDVNQGDTVVVSFVVPGTSIPWPGGINATIKQSHGDDVNVSLSHQVTFRFNMNDNYGDVYGEIKQIDAGVGEPTLISSNLDADPNSVVDGNTTDVTVWLYDQYGAPLADQNVSIYDDGVLAGTASQTSPGVYVLTGVMPEYGQVNTMSAKVDGTPIPETENVTVTKAPGYLDDSDLDANPNTVVDGNTTDVTVWLYDQYDDPLTGKEVKIYDDGVYVGIAIEGPAGVYVLEDVLPTYGETNKMTATVSGLSIPDFENVAVTKAPSYLDESDLDADPNSVVDGNTTDVKVWLYDQYGEPLTGKTVMIYDDTVLVGQAVETAVDGIYLLEDVLPTYGEVNRMSATVDAAPIPQYEDVTVTKAEGVLTSSVLDAEPNPVYDGEYTNVTVWLYDQYGDPFTGATVDVFDDEVLVSQAYDDDDGVYVLENVLPTYGEDNTMSAMVGDYDVENTEDVLVLKGDGELTSSTLDADPNPVMDGNTTFVTVELFDQYGDPLPGQTVTIYHDGELVGEAIEGPPGVYILEVLPIYGETNTMSAMVGEYVVPQTEDVVVTKAPGYLDDSLLDANPNSVVDGNTTDVTVWLYDQYDDPFTGATVDVYDDGDFVGTAVEGPDGEYVLVGVLPTYGEDNTMSAMVGEDPVANTEDVEVTKAEGILTSSELDADPNPIVEGNTTDVTVWLFDQYGDPYTDVTVEIYDDGDFAGFAIEGEDGEYVLVGVLPEYGQVNTMSAYVDEDDYDVPETEDVVVTKADGYLDSSLLDANPNSVQDGEYTEVTVWLFDQYEDPFPGATVNIYDDGVFAGVATEESPGVYVLDVLPEYGEVNTMSATVGEYDVPNTEDVEVTKGLGYLDDSALDADPNSVLEGNTTDVTVWLYDQYDDPLQGATVVIYDDGVEAGTASEVSPGVYVLENVLPEYGQTNTMTAEVNEVLIPQSEDVSVTRPSSPPPPAPVIGVTLDTDAVTLDYGEGADPDFLFYDFTETVTGTNDKRVTWSLDDDTYAFVDENGVVRARDDIEPGTGDIVVTVTVTTVIGGATDTAEILFLEQTPLGAIEFYDPYVVGYPENLFGPDREVTRAEVAAMFARILKMRLEFPGSPKFGDVSMDEWYYPYVQAIYRTGIFVGDGNGMFRPDDPISRAEVATVFSKLWQFTDIDVDSSPVEITDVSSSHWASNYIYQMYNAGMVVGFGDGTYRPNDNTLRDQFVVMVNKLISRPQYEAPFTKYRDIDNNYWAYGDIEAATQPFSKQAELQPE